MPASSEIRDMITLTGRYYARLRELLAEVPDGGFDARVGSAGLTVLETIRHVAACDLWYLNSIDGGSRQAPEAEASRAGLEGLLAHSEREMVAFLEEVTPETLDEVRQVRAWWAAHSECSVRIILTQSMAHKYYHCGQVQSTLYAMRG